LLVSELVLLGPATCDGRLIGLKFSIAGGCHAHFSNVLSLSFGINDSSAIHEGDLSGDDFRARPFKLLALLGQIISLLGSMASLTLVSRQLLAQSQSLARSQPSQNRLYSCCELLCDLPRRGGGIFHSESVCCKTRLDPPPL
jgi:hypothetical protein